MARLCAVMAFSVPAVLSCASPALKTERLALRLSPAALGAAISVQQRLSFEGGGHSGVLDAALEVDAEQLRFVGITLGQRVLALQFDGKTLQSWRHPALAEQLRDEDVLDDLQLTLWPAQAIRQALPAGWRIEDSGLRRAVSAAGVPVALIEYSGEPRWLGKIELSNLRYGYRLTIQSVPSGAER